jgi:two-component system, OmpR family, sensor histidine kinase CiaH
MLQKGKKINRIFIIYWVLLAYIVAALIWWFISLSNQNKQMSQLKINELSTTDVNYAVKYSAIIDTKKRKVAQYVGEGATFLLLIIAGAIFIFRAIRKELRITAEQQNFMMAITHELKTPIAVAKLNLETVQKHKLTEQQQDRLLQNTLTETNRLDTLCSNLLLSTQMEGGGYKAVKEKLNFSKLVDDATSAFTTRFTTREVLKNITPNIEVIGDAFLLQIAINNLLENAAKYSAKEKVIKVSVTMQGNNVQLQVIDEGVGISDTDKKLVFNKFYRTGNEATKKAKGTGLGLYLTKRICQTHDANITVQNNSNAGSIFTFAINTAA